MTAAHALPLQQQRCSHQSGPALTPDEQSLLLSQLQGWQVDASTPGGALTKTYTLADFHHTMAFVNAVAFVAHTQDHHPSLQVTYRECTVRYTSHDIQGLSERDFVCAAHIDALLA